MHPLPWHVLNGYRVPPNKGPFRHIQCTHGVVFEPHLSEENNNHKGRCANIGTSRRRLVVLNISVKAASSAVLGQRLRGTGTVWYRRDPVAQIPDFAVGVLANYEEATRKPSTLYPFLWASYPLIVPASGSTLAPPFDLWQDLEHPFHKDAGEERLQQLHTVLRAGYPGLSELTRCRSKRARVYICSSGFNCLCNRQS